MNCDNCIWKQSESNGRVKCRVFELANGTLKERFYERPAVGCKQKKEPTPRQAIEPMPARRNFNYGNRKMEIEGSL